MKKLKILIFWLLSLTWGSIMSVFGLVCALALILTGHKPKVFHYLIYFEVGNGSNGFEAGCFFFCNKQPSLHLKQHEAGHGIQNIILGPLMPILVSIPSCIRYWYRRWLVKHGKKLWSELPDYDAFWVEHWATSLGEKYFREVGNKNEI